MGGITIEGKVLKDEKETSSGENKKTENKKTLEDRLLYKIGNTIESDFLRNSTFRNLLIYETIRTRGDIYDKVTSIFSNYYEDSTYIISNLWNYGLKLVSSTFDFNLSRYSIEITPLNVSKQLINTAKEFNDVVQNTESYIDSFVKTNEYFGVFADPFYIENTLNDIGSSGIVLGGLYFLSQGLKSKKLDKSISNLRNIFVSKIKKKLKNFLEEDK